MQLIPSVRQTIQGVEVRGCDLIEQVWLEDQIMLWLDWKRDVQVKPSEVLRIGMRQAAVQRVLELIREKFFISETVTATALPT